MLYYFQGREALALLEQQGPFGLAKNAQSWTVFQGQAAQDAIQAGEARPLQRLALAASAFLTATQINPDYVTAYIGLGNVYFHRGQFALLASQPVTTNITTCTPELSVAQIQNTEQLSVTPTGAIREIDQAIRYYEMAVDKAPEVAMSPLLPVAQVMGGYSYALKGMAFLLQNEQEPQVERLDQAKTELLRAVGEMNAPLQPFREQQQFDFLAFGYYGLGQAYRALAYLHAQQQDMAEARDSYQLAHQNYKQCIALEATPNPDGDTDLQKRIGCSCRVWDDIVINDSTTLGGGSG